ncbi:MAG TPA: UDP-N-acetylmuramoyl-L-alanine--D-glutamate ligase [Patescibacteria group bacterium]|nr:UDP-N-acetylmuramoyl-L-alanine--D-glutamate ligase [Patescibacteria group bacterium]
MKVAIVGYGIDGKSALAYWQKRGAEITICDQSKDVDIPPGISVQLGDRYLENMQRFDVVMRSSGIHPNVIIKDNPGVASKITSVVNEFLRVCPTKNTIGVTGTKGKGTTSTLITKMLEAAGKKVFVGGNIGISPFDFLEEVTPDSWVVLELSSYQLFDLQHSTHIAICLMMAPEHLNWHGDLEKYTTAKAQLFRRQTAKDVAIYYAENRLSHRIASNSPGDKIAYYDEPGAYIFENKVMIDQTVLCTTDELQLLGKHNWQNVCAAVTAVWQVAQVPDAIRKVLIHFTGLPHRLELIREVDGVRYYNDSYSSAPPATIAALQAIDGKKIMILGGFDRLLPLDHLVSALKEHQKDIRMALIIGASGMRLGTELKAADFKPIHMSSAKDMAHVVADARKFAKKGDAVVLSPGFPSFDMFKNFEVRGLQFKEIVHAL